MASTTLISAAEAATLLKVSVKTIHRWVDAEQLPVAIQFPGRRGARMFLRADVEALLERERS